MVQKIRQDMLRRGQFCRSPVIRLTLIAAGLAGLSPWALSQEASSRAGTVQTVRLFGNVGAEPADDPLTLPLAPASTSPLTRPAPVARELPAAPPAVTPVATPVVTSVAAPVAERNVAPVTAPVAAALPTLIPAEPVKVMEPEPPTVAAAPPVASQPAPIPVAPGPPTVTSTPPAAPQPAPVPVEPVKLAAPERPALAPPAPPLALIAAPVLSAPTTSAAFSQGQEPGPAPPPVQPAPLMRATPPAEPVPPIRSAQLFGNVGVESQTPVQPAAPTPARQPDTKFIVAQAPGAGGAAVPPVPATPQVQSLPAPVAPPAALANPGGPKFEIRSFEVEGATLIPKERFAPLLRPYIGVNRDFGDVQQALEVVEKLFVAEGFGSVQVLLPEQELEQGAIKFKVVEPKIARVLVEGNKEYTEANILASLPGVKIGEAPNSNVIAANLRMANENPGKATTVLLRAGSNDGEVDAVVKVTEDKSVKYSYGFDNTGTDVTGRGAAGNYRHSLGFTNANILERDHVLSGQVITSPTENHDFRAGISKDVLIIGLSYRIPLYEYGNMLDFTAGYSNVNSGAVQNIFTVSGRGSVFGVRLTQNLARIGDYDHRLIYAADYRAYANSVVPIGGGNAIVPDITVKPVSLTYSGTFREATAETNGYLSFNQNLPGGGNGGSGQWEAGTTATGTGARAGGRPGYTLWRYGFTHYRAFANDWQARFNLVGQATKDRLIAPEQFGLGGANSVRGFVERQFSNDWGSYANFEVYTPDFASHLNINNETKMRLVMFEDYGHLVRNGPQPAETARVSASGAGFGLRVTQGSSLSIKLDAAWANWPSNTGDTNRPTVTRKFRMHGSILYLF